MRIIIALLDGVGIGELPDASFYGDEGSNTLRNTAQVVGGLSLPALEKLGLGWIDDIPGVKRTESPLAFTGKMKEQSPGKDTTTGHWEIAGIILEKPFPVYPQGFPPSIIKELEKAWGRKILGNKPASGTVIIEELGKEHLKTGYLIVYTSADSVLQVAAHEEVIPLSELYEMCQKAREIMRGEHAVARIIARPFVGRPGQFQRTANRRDFSLPPPKDTILDILARQGKENIGVGKIQDIFAGKGLKENIKIANNEEGFRVLQGLQKDKKGDLVWVNFNDFDTVFGHRNNPQGFAQALESWDRELSSFLPSLREDEVLFITADHGCDPTTPSTDHSREYVPLLVFSPGHFRCPSLGIRETFSDIAATIAQLMEVEWNGPGKSLALQILSGKNSS